ncbi:TPA: nucleotidyltransferase domain-containing protein [Legionella pneumophila]|nr:nucleotidyltransferase domain-containing protein [Legionella pneumophila]HBD7410355.1 nucleotidyltransferase domain-containing protein [Legionella pneumophila]HBD9405548.1 nucleotidyltransferase domain-containing protein [Legionella pneumophila]HBI2968777.1 nucleotidyltransferase domain-containing protein [Legionella pneumophila]
MSDKALDDIVAELEEYGCHTIILYGSRARGDYTDLSDYDVIGIRTEGESFRIARYEERNQVYFDLFVYSEVDFITIQEAHLNIHEGKILIEKNQFGQKLLERVNKEIKKPVFLSKNELEVRKVWYEKMLNRAKRRDIEGVYRHIWMLHTLIEDYFAVRNIRYLGPKKGLQYLSQHAPEIISLYEKALIDTQNLTVLEKLIQSIFVV